jgi:hypothetical protein
MIQAFERAKTIHALDRVATLIGTLHYISDNFCQKYYTENR